MSNRDEKHRYRPADQADAFTGEIFQAKAWNHYEANNGEPHSPEIEQPRLTTRERVELLTRGGFDLYSVYRQPDDQAPDDDLDVVDEDGTGDPPLTPGERAYLEISTEREKAAQELYEASQRPPPPAAPENASAGSPTPASPSAVPAEPARPAPATPSAHPPST